MNRLLQSWVSQHADSRPDATAIVSGAGTEAVSYAQLERSSNQLAHLLQAVGCKKGDRVCILMPKSPAAVLSMLGALKAGCMHVPIDSSSPAARIRQILDSCENRCILASGNVAPLLDELLADPQLRARISVGWLDSQPLTARSFQPAFSKADLEAASPTPLPQQCTSDDGSHILFTSGSTGVPKGVVITHSNVISFVAWALTHFRIDHTDRFSGHTPFHFDLSTFDIFGTLTAGAQLHLVPPEFALLPAKLVEFIRTSELTQWFSVPSVLNYLAKFDALKDVSFPALRRVLWCGEVLPTPALIYWMQHLPHIPFTNLYGPTEATIASSYYDVPRCPEDPKASIPIGKACDGEEILVLGDKLQPLPAGETGDLYIAGAGLSPGYWRDPAKTEAAFLCDPQNPSHRLYRTGDLAWLGEDGLVYFVGRADTQIKVRGYRIELGEIETALNSIGTLQECAVVAVANENFGGWMICCAYVARKGEEVAPNALREHLKKLIPSYMFPVRWRAYEGLPKNANGKIDRPRLKEKFAQDEKTPSAGQAADASGGEGRAKEATASDQTISRV
jgi:amino acid adenylation domain-containing protein